MPHTKALIVLELKVHLINMHIFSSLNSSLTCNVNSCAIKSKNAWSIKVCKNSFSYQWYWCLKITKMMLKTIESWIKSKSIFDKGFAISGIVIILVVFLDLMINRSLINQYIYILSYVIAAVTTSISTGNSNL